MFRKVTALVAGPLLVVAACAHEADQGAVEVRTGAAATSALRAAPDAVADVGTARFELVMEMAAMGESFEVNGSGAYDAEAQQVAMTLDMGSLVEELAGTSDEGLPDDLDGAWHVVSDGDAVYMKAPIFEIITGAPGWLSVTPEDLGTGATSLGLGAGAFDPSKVLEALRGVAGEPEVVGTEEIRGVATTHYRAEIALSDALARVPEDRRAEVEAALEQLGEISSSVIPVDAWMDGDDLPRRIQVDMAGAFGDLVGGDATPAMTMTIDLFGYGDPVDIEVPSPDEVTPLGEVIGDLGPVAS